MAESVISISSNRIYLDTLSDKAREGLLHTLDCYNKAKEALYNFKYDREFLAKNTDVKETVFIKQWMQENLQLRPQEYYITSLAGQVSGMIRSQRELQKLYDEELQLRCDNRQDKIRSTYKQLQSMRNLKQRIVKVYKRGRAGKDEVAIPFYLRKQYPDTSDTKQLYDLELYVDKEIKRLLARISQIQWKDERDIQTHQTIPARMTFGGGKAFYKKKDTTDINMTEWHKERDFNRTKTVQFAGRFDAKFKNWLCKYDISEHLMDITLMNGTVLHLSNVVFPYREEDLKTVLLHPKQSGYSVGYTLELRKDHLDKTFILIRAAFRIYEERLNLDTNTGVISIDMNYDNISWSELNKDGVRLRGRSIYFDLEGKTSNQRKDILGRVCSRIIQLCVDTKKPLVMEDISLQKKKASLAYGMKTANRKTSEFAYQMMTSLLYGKALQRSVGIIKVNPAYTSQIGKMKYMKHMRSTVHLAASYVIGRRGMGFSEKVPAYLKELIPDNKKYSHHWKKYAHLMTALKNFKVKFFLTEVPVITDVEQYRDTKYCFS